LDPAWLDRVSCPVGDSRTGKAPREVAIALAQQVLLEEARLRPGETSAVCPGDA
jgi:xanthine/CO dehydrogenase XdhC/CoxF family maturation factor